MTGLRKKGIIIGTSIIILSCILAVFVTISKSHLSAFRITRVEELDGHYMAFFQSCRNAEEYRVRVTDAYDNTLWEETTNENEIRLDHLSANYKDELSLKVTAVHENKEEIQADNVYAFTWERPSISDKTTHRLTDALNLEIFLDGIEAYENLSLTVVYNEKDVYETKITSSKVEIPTMMLDFYHGKITLQIRAEDKRVLDSYNVYNDVFVVEDISIFSPTEGDQSYDDVEFSFRGGKNATEYKLNIYEGKKKINTITLIGNETTISAKYFEPNKEYRLEVMAILEDYIEIAKKDEVTIHFGSKLTTNPVYTNYNWENIKKGTEITLSTKTKNADIYYTVDGTDPKKYGKKYDQSFQIESDITIKAYATNENRYDSEVSTYNFHIGNKTPIIYLSPSNQSQNYGVSSVGYTTEKEMMNRIADIVEQKLKDAGIIVYRNDPEKDIPDWLYESKKVHADFHFAIHSNASIAHESNGMEIFVNEHTSKSLSIANKIYDDLYKIYPYKSKEAARGVRFASGSLGETTISNGALIEIAFHDEKNDAKWIVTHLEEIANTLAKSMIEFYQVGDIE